MWAQPWAWLGLAGLAVPFAIHLLARHQAVRALFPTLRFIDASELNAIKRQRVTDIPLMLVRMLMIALAVAAIAGPRLGAAAVAADVDPAHVTVYDMTASAASGRSDSFVSMRRRAHVRTESLPEGIRAAAAWAVSQPGERQITVVSDFQRGSLDESAIGLVPKGVGLRFERVKSTLSPLPAGFSIGENGVRMAWPVPAPTPLQAIQVVAGTEQADADRMLAAVLTVTPVPETPVGIDRHNAVFVFPKATDREDMIRRITPIDEAWMFAAVKTLLARWPKQVRVGVAEPQLSQLIVIFDAAPASLDAAEAVASVASELNNVVRPSEREPRTIADDQLKQWERPAESAVLEREGEPQGRWLWIGVLALLAVETWMRRRVA